MDILRTDSPIVGFEFPTLHPLTRPSPAWHRALPLCVPTDDDIMDESDELCMEAEADLVSLVHHLSFPVNPDQYSDSSSTRSSYTSRASSSSSFSTVGCSSAVHTPTSSMDYQFSPRSLAKSRSFASLSLSQSGRRAAVYIVDDDDEPEAVDKVHFPVYDMVVDDCCGPEALLDEPPSRFSIDEDRPRSSNMRDLFTRSRALSMQTPSPSSSRSIICPPIPAPPPPTPRKSKRKTMLSMLHLAF